MLTRPRSFCHEVKDKKKLFCFFYGSVVPETEAGERDCLGIVVDCVPRLRVSQRNTFLDQPEKLIGKSASSVEVGNVNVQM
jgi:hypothetical protein